MTLNQFVQINRLRPADAVMLNKKIFGMLDHYVIYLGVHHGEHKFSANTTEGIRVIPHHELRDFLKILIPKQIHRFKGGQVERVAAVNRAIEQLGRRNYDLLENNCEHYKNLVQKGVPSSSQSDTFKQVIGTTFVAAVGFGLLAAILGGKRN